MTAPAADVDALARALHRAHHAALDALHGDPYTPATPYDLETPERRAYLREQAAALIAEGVRVNP